MTDPHVRLATLADLTRLTELWGEQQTITQQLDPRLIHTSPTEDEWRAAVQIKLEKSSGTDVVLVVERDGLLLGFVSLCAMPEANHGTIVEMVIDAHRGQGGLGSLLLNAAYDWFHERQIGYVVVEAVPRNHAVQQAFWRAKGASLLQESFYLRVKPTGEQTDADS
jgi:RimJ/RimL family protein N-acetyltransferase